MLSYESVGSDNKLHKSYTREFLLCKLLNLLAFFVTFLLSGSSFNELIDCFY